MRPKKTTKEKTDYSAMSREQLKTLLKDGVDARPRYLFSAVEEIADIRENRYVFWLDLMGARNAMKLSLPRAARSIMKIHAAALHAKQQSPSLEINPVMDGVYGLAQDRESMELALKSILTALAHVFVLERVTSSRFMVRAGVSFGPVVPGATLAAGSQILMANIGYLGGTAIGMAISHAYEAERSAPPFGVYIHESARAFAPVTGESFPYRTNLWRWFDKKDAITWALRRTLVGHFDWLRRNPVAALYDKDAEAKHRALSEEYFELHELPTLVADK